MNYIVHVKSEEESRKAQKMAFDRGYRWPGTQETLAIYTGYQYLYFQEYEGNYEIRCSKSREWHLSNHEKEITFSQWMSMDEKKQSMEWTELKIDDLPGDILTGDYEFEYFMSGEWKKSEKEGYWVIFTITDNMMEGRSSYPYRYRPRHQETLSHKERIEELIKNIDGEACGSLAHGRALGYAVMYLLQLELPAEAPNV